MKGRERINRYSNNKTKPYKTPILFSSMNIFFVIISLRVTERN